MRRTRIIVIGGGAAGFFGAIACARANPENQVILLEATKDPLAKVRISGGGRCNLTHDCRDPRELVTHYPRGRRELLGPFHHFGPSETIRWFGDEGVRTKIEDDGRMFPVSDTSESITRALIGAARRAKVEIRTNRRVESIEARGQHWSIGLKDRPSLSADRILVASGSSLKVWDMLAKLGLQIVPPVPSLFSFKTRDPRLADLAGISVPRAQLHVEGTKLRDGGPILITHQGFSGPAVLRLSAWGARTLNEASYAFDLNIDWTGIGAGAAKEALNTARKARPRKQVRNYGLFDLPIRLWRRIVEDVGIEETRRWADLSRVHAEALLRELTASRFKINGKSPFKEGFVTAGGVSLKEIDFKRFAARRFPGLYLAGEVLDIDAVTGGFNFQAAWTGGWLAGQAMAS